MDDSLLWDPNEEAESRLRVAHGAIRQAGRHERAIAACLAELDGIGAPSLSQVAFIIRRARRHADRGRGLASMATRVNRDPGLAPALAATLERHERATLAVANWTTEVSAASPSGAR